MFLANTHNNNNKKTKKKGDTTQYPPVLPNAGVWMAHEAAEPAHSKPKPSAWPPIPTLAALPTVHHHISLHVPWLIMSMRADGLACNVDSDLTGITKSWLSSPPAFLHTLPCPASRAGKRKKKAR